MLKRSVEKSSAQSNSAKVPDRGNDAAA